MKRITTLATVALLWAGAVKANDFATSIAQAYAAAGYSNIVVQHVHGDWLVTGDLAGLSQSFLVNRKTGAATAVELASVLSGEDSAGHDLGDDHGVDGAGHDAGDDTGGDDAGGDAAGDDTGGDHGGAGGGSDD